MSEKQRNVLVEFFAIARASSHPVPDRIEIDAMVDSYPQWPAGLSAVANAWQAPAQHLCKQVQFGVHNPIVHIPTDLTRPDPALLPPPPAEPPAEPAPAAAVPAPAASGGPSRDPVDPLADHLIRWKQQMLSRRPDDPVLTQLKDKSHLRQIAQRNARTHEEVSRLLPHAEGFQKLVPDLVRVIGEFHASTRGQDEPAGPPQQPIAPPEVVPEDARAAAVHTAPHAPVVPERIVADPTPAEPITPAAHFDVDPHGFAPAPRAQGAGTAPEMTTAVTESKGVFAAWRPLETTDAVVLYRVVSMDDALPWSPEVGRMVAVTTGTQLQDDSEFTAAIRYYSVWANAGATVAQAKAAQPIAVAQGFAIALVRSFDPREEGGSVVAQWQVWPGATSVHVFRVPLEKAATGRGSPQYRIQAGRKNLSGFQDPDCKRGRAYLYQAAVEVFIDGMPVLSDPVDREVRVPPVLEPVTDLSATLHGPESAPRFNLQWTQPAVGEVVIFRTEDAPPSGLGDQERNLDQIEDWGKLTAASRLPWPAEIEGDTASVSDVPWPKDWARAHFTPVTMIGNRVAVGKTVTKVRVEQIVDADLHERVSEQLITFTWPRGATTVHVFRTQKGIPAESIVNGPTEQAWGLNRDTWQKEGGFRTPSPLNHNGCAIHLLPVAYHEGRTYPGLPSSLEYVGLRRINYQLDWRRGRTRNATALVLMLTAAIDMPSAPQFYLIANPTRFPLDSRDGRPVPVTRVGYDGSEPQRIITPDSLGPEPRDDGWLIDVDGFAAESGWPWYYARLFADLPAERLQYVAVLDPPIETLIVRRT